MTTSVVPECEAALVTLVNAAIVDDATFHRAWPGHDATRRMGFLTETVWDNYEDVALKSGARKRRERFDMNFELWEFTDIHASQAGDASDACMAQLAVIEGVLRAEATKQLGVDGVQWAVVSPDRKQPFEFDQGWGYAITGAVTVEAYLR